jgi:hypothetical protein
MKISPNEINAALVAFFGANEPLSAANYNGIKAALKAALLVRKARKARKKAKQPMTDDITGIPIEHGMKKAERDALEKETRAALRKLGAAIAREFPGVSG